MTGRNYCGLAYRTKFFCCQRLDVDDDIVYSIVLATTAQLFIAEPQFWNNLCYGINHSYLFVIINYLQKLQQERLYIHLAFKVAFSNWIKLTFFSRCKKRPISQLVAQINIKALMTKSKPIQ